MSATTPPFGSADLTNTIIRIYIDNSNLWIGGKQCYAATYRPHLKQDPDWRVDYNALPTELIRPITRGADVPDDNVSIDLFGSGSMWKVIKNMNIRIHLFDRSPMTGKEKRVDTSLMMHLGRALERDLGSGVTAGVHYVVVSGDWDIAGTAIDDLKKCGFPLHVWAWNRCMARPLRDVKPGENLTIHCLDDVLDRITLDKHAGNSKGTLDIPLPFHPQSLVTNPPTDTETNRQINNVIRPLLVPWQEGQINQNLVITPVLPDMDSNGQQQLLDRFVREAKDNWILKKRGCQVLTFKEYQTKHRPAEDNSGDAHRLRNNIFSHPNSRFSRNKYGEPNTIGRATQSRPHIWCRYRQRCGKGLQCTYGHTDEERELFRAPRYGHGKTLTKIKMCNYGQRCRNQHYCRFAHGEAELFCPTCDGYGHEMKNCRANWHA